MTPLTELAKLTLMLIDFFVTGSAGTLDNKLTILDGQLVARITAWLLVTTIQFELGELVVIKVPRLPRTCVVASLTLLTETLFVRLLFIFLMT